MIFTLTCVLGCRVTEDDIERWATRASGPRKLVAVLQHDKYSPPLRIDAALTLVRMKPRGGQAVGLQGGEDAKGLLAALAELPPPERKLIVSGLVTPLEEGMRRPVQDGRDETFPYKDAAYALLTDARELVEEPAAKERLRAALVTWTGQDFERRMDDTSQLYGMEQLLRLLRDDAMKGLAPLLVPGFKKTRALAKLISELGSDATQLDASQRLVGVASAVASDKWLAEQRAAVAKANQAAGHQVTDKQLQKQLATYQEEELVRAFGAMKFVGKKPITDYLISLAQDAKLPEDRRKAAVAALEGNLDQKDPEHARAMLALLASDDCPDGLRDLAARRIGELSRDLVAKDLYELFSHKRWQIRWTAATLLLKMTSKEQLDEFMAELGRVREIALTEALSYGPLLSEVSPADAKQLALKYADRQYPTTVRVSALGYFYRHGTARETAELAPLTQDRARVPRCPKDAEGQTDTPGCAWTCTVTEQGQSMAKEVQTVGEFVDSCLIFAMKSRPDEQKPAQPPTAAPALPQPPTAAPAPLPTTPAPRGASDSRDASSPKNSP